MARLTQPRAGGIARRAALCCALAVVVALLGAGCGGGKAADASSTQQWSKVLTTEISGATPVKVNLGIYTLGGGVRLAWVLSGPEKPPATLTFRVVQVAKGYAYGGTTSPQANPEFELDDDSVFEFMPIWPGKYRIYFGQRFAASRGPGYDAKLTVYTLK